MLVHESTVGEMQIRNSVDLNEDIANAKVENCQIIEAEHCLTSGSRRILTNSCGISG